MKTVGNSTDCDDKVFDELKEFPLQEMLTKTTHVVLFYFRITCRYPHPTPNSKFYENFPQASFTVEKRAL